MTPDLPPELKVALDRKTEGLSRIDAARRASAISQSYRGGGDSKTIKTEDDALAYALARMPATYAAVAACLTAIIAARPDFAPNSLLDVGAGPGTATWASARAYSTLREFTLLDSNNSLRNLALELAASNSGLSSSKYLRGEASNLLADVLPADIVIASYLIGELGKGQRMNLANSMWSKTRGALLIVEPGTPAGYERILELRGQLIAGGAHVIAPCPHDNACPLTAPDWCHFTQRLARSRVHKQIKGAELSYEDEKFSYVALSRQPVASYASRVLTQPKISKVAVTMKLCTANGVEFATIPHRDKRNYSTARKLNWGDAVSEKNLASE